LLTSEPRLLVRGPLTMAPGKVSRASIGLSPLLPPTIEVSTKQYQAYLHNYALYVQERNKLRASLNEKRSARLERAAPKTKTPPPKPIPSKVRQDVGAGIVAGSWKKFCESAVYQAYTQLEREAAKSRWSAAATRRNKRIAKAKASAAEAKAKAETAATKSKSYAEAAKSNLRLRNAQAVKLVEETKILTQRRLRKENTSTAQQTKRTRAYVVPQGATLHTVVETETVLGTSATATPSAEDSDRLVRKINQSMYDGHVSAQIHSNPVPEATERAQTELAQIRLLQAKEQNMAATARFRDRALTAVGGTQLVYGPPTPCPTCGRLPMSIHLVCDCRICPNNGIAKAVIT